MVQLLFALHFGQAADGIKVIGFDAVKIVLALRVEQAEHRVGISLAINMRHAPGIANNLDLPGLLLPAGHFCFGEFLRLGSQRQQAQKER